jgi:hypothetical protein
MCTSFLVLRSKDDSDATVRLQSDALLRGLKNLPNLSAKLAHPSEQFQIETGTCVLFHFDDLPAITFLRESRDRGNKFITACFGSDIYEFSRYLPSYEVADVYLMPTALHRKVLASQFYKPVFYLGEAIDPIAGADAEYPPKFSIRKSRKLLWFGYSDSFNKGMASLIPILKLHLKSGLIQDFSLILDKSDFSNDFGFPTIPFHNSSFRREAAAFDYCILSHFSLDLSLNSYIKSPNKLMTALMSGLIPIASDTPSYSSILRESGLGNFLFDSPAQLDRILRNLDPRRDSQQIIDSGIIEKLWVDHSANTLAKRLVAIVQEYEARSYSELVQIKPSMMPQKQRPIYFTEHVKDLVPSLFRAVHSRLSKPTR